MIPDRAKAGDHPVGSICPSGLAQCEGNRTRLRSPALCGAFALEEPMKLAMILAAITLSGCMSLPERCDADEWPVKVQTGRGIEYQCEKKSP